MSEKRFKETVSTGIVTDTITEKEYRCEMRIDEDLLELLNELHEENHSLKFQLDECRNNKLFSRRQLEKENEQLKKREEQLLFEIEDFQQLLTNNDNICYKRVIDLINTRIKNGEEAIEWGKSMDADYGAMGFHVEMLKLLKKELEE